MDIGQALAMMRYANQVKDYQSQLDRQPNIDWRDISQAGNYGVPGYAQPVGNFIPEGSREMPFSYGDVIAGLPAELPPPTPMGMPMPVEPGYVPADQTFQELYGMPAEPQMGESFSYSPVAMTGVMGGYPSVSEQHPGPAPSMAQAYTMPPLPIPGAAPAEPRREISARPEPAMTDVPMEQPMDYSQPVAMLQEGEQASNIVPEQPQQMVQETKPAFKPGDDFKVNLQFGDKQYEAIVRGYVPPRSGEMGPKAINVVIPSLNNKVMALPSNSQQYQTISDEYERIKPLSVIGDEYPSLVRVSGIVDPVTKQPTWLPAKIDAETNQILYKDPDTGVPAVYTDKRISDVTEQDFQGTLDQRGIRDNSELIQLQQRRLQPLNQSIEKINNVATGFRGNDPEYIIRNNLRGTLGPGTLDNPLGEISWSYTTQDGTQLSLEDASKAGYLPQGFAQEIDSAYQNFKSTALERARSVVAAQTAQPLSQTQRDIQIINDNIKINEDRKQQIQADQKYAESKKGKQEIKDIDKALDTLRKKLTSVTTTVSASTIAGGSTVFTAIPDVTAYDIDATTQAGLLSVLAGAAALPSQSGAGMQTVTPWTPEDLIVRVRENALAKSNPYLAADDPEYMNAMSSLSQRLQNIQQAAAEYSSSDGNVEPEDIVNSPNAIFRYTPIAGGPAVTETMSLSQAVRDLEESAANFRDLAASGDASAAATAKEKFAQAAQRFTGMLVMPGVGPFSASPAETRGFNNLMRRFQPALAADYPLTRSVQMTPGMRVAEAPKTTVVPPRSGGGATPTVQSGIVYPLWNTPGSTFGKSGFEKADETYNIFERMGHNEQTYVGGGKAYSEGAIGQTTIQNLSRIFGDDSGSSLSPAAIAAVNDSVNSFNKKIINDPALRATYANMLWDITKASGYPPGVSAGELAKRLENVYYVAKTNPSKIDVAIGYVLQGVRGEGPSKNYQQALKDQNYNVAKAEVGNQVVAILNAAKTGGKPEFEEYAGKIPGHDTRLADNVLQQWYELATLYAAAANGKTMYPSGNATVTWMYNPADPNTAYFRSALTIPAAKTGNVDKLLPAAKASDGKNVTGVSADVGAEPVYSAFIMRSNQVLNGANANAFRTSFKTTLAPVVQESKQAFTARGVNLAGQSAYRPSDDDNVRWTNSSSNVIEKLTTDVLLLSNVLGRNRDRKNVYSGGWKPFDPAKAR